MEKNEEMLEFEFLDELEDKPEIPDKVNYENEYYEYFKDINEIIRNSEHPKWDIVKATIKEAARDTFEKISFGVTNNRFVNGFKDRWNEMASKGYAFKENTKEGIKAYINMSKYEYNKFTNREKPKLNFPKISLFEFSLKNTLMDMITDKVIERLDKDTYSFVMNNSNEDVKHTVKGLTKEMMDNGEITIEKQAVDILQSKYNIPAKRRIEEWVHAYREFGEEGLMRSRQNKKYTFQFKLSMVELYLSSEVSYQELALSQGISNPSLIVKWVNDFRIAGPDALRPKKKGRKKTLDIRECKKPSKYDGEKPVDTSAEHVKELEDELLKLRIENAYLKELRRLRLEEETLLKKQRELSTVSEDSSN